MRRRTRLDIHDLLSVSGYWASFVVCPEQDLDSVHVDEALKDSSAIVRILRGNRCPTVDRLFQEMAAALQFPAYFGHNWDAMAECIEELDWYDWSACLIILTRTDLLLHGHENDFRILCRVLGKAATAWSAQRGNRGSAITYSAAKPFKVVFHSEPGKKNEARQRLLDARVII